MLSYRLNKFGHVSVGLPMAGDERGIELESARKRGGNAPRIDDVEAGGIWIPLDGF